MEGYRFQELAYLALPVMLGMEFFMSAREEKRGQEETPVGSYVLDFFGFVFMALVPAIFLFTIWAVESKSFPDMTVPLAKFDRYGVLFLFMGGWWQTYIFGALRARRMRRKETSPWYLWGPFLGLGLFISLLVLWSSPWNLKWVSAVWFLLISGVMIAFRVRLRTVERVLWGLAAITFIFENALFLWLESVV